MPATPLLRCVIRHAAVLTLATVVAGIPVAQADAQNTQEAADTPDLAIAGMSISERSSYSYVGVIKPILGGTVGQGWFGQATANYLTYRYPATLIDQTQSIHASAPGIDVGVGYGWRGSAYALSLLTSVGNRNIRLSPNDPGARARGNVTTLTPQLQARWAFSEQLDSDLIASYVFGQRSSFARFRVGWRASPHQARIGLEETLQRGTTYQIHQHGLFIDQYVAPGLALQLSGGVVLQQGQSRAPYLSLGLSRFF